MKEGLFCVIWKRLENIFLMKGRSPLARRGSIYGKEERMIHGARFWRTWEEKFPEDGEISFGGMGSFTLSSNTVMSLAASFPSKVVLQCLLFIVLLSLLIVTELAVTFYCHSVF